MPIPLRLSTLRSSTQVRGLLQFPSPKAVKKLLGKLRRSHTYCQAQRGGELFLITTYGRSLCQQIALLINDLIHLNWPLRGCDLTRGGEVLILKHSTLPSPCWQHAWREALTSMVLHIERGSRTSGDGAFKRWSPNIKALPPPSP